MNVVSHPSWLEGVRSNFARGNDHGKIVVIDDPQEGDPEGTKAAVIVQIADMSLIFRIPLTKQEVMNLSRALLEAVL